MPFSKKRTKLFSKRKTGVQWGRPEEDKIVFMKKKILTVLGLSSLLTLAACGNTVDPVVPEGGSSVDVVTGTTSLKKAVVAMDTQDALAIKLNKMNLDFNGSMDLPLSRNSSFSTLPESGSFNLSNVSFFAGATGLTSEKAADQKFQVSLGGNVAFKTNLLTPSESSGYDSHNADISQSGVAFNGYYANQTTYLDLSNQALVDLVGKVFTFIGYPTVSSNTDDQGNYTKTVATGLKKGQYNVAGFFGNTLPAPLFGNTTVNGYFEQFGTKLESYLDAAGDAVSVKSFSDGTSSVELSFTKEILASYVGAAIASFSTKSETISALKKEVATVMSGLTVNSCKAGLVFTEKGIKKVNWDINLAYKTTYDQLASAAVSAGESNASVPSGLVGKGINGSFVFNGGIDVLMGSEVSLSLPSDFSAYKTSVTKPVDFMVTEVQTGKVTA